MLITILRGTWLGAEAFFELMRASLFPKRSIRAALRIDAPELCGCVLTPPQREFIRQLARMVWRISKLIPVRCRCIHRSVAALRILQRRGIPCRLVIAPISVPTRDCTAHAWVESPENLSVGSALGGAVMGEVLRKQRFVSRLTERV